MMGIEVGGGGLGADPALEELRREYQEGNLVIFAGAGVSVAAGLPSLEGLAATLTEHARNHGASDAVLREIAERTRERRFPEVLSAAESLLGAPRFGTLVAQELDDRRIDEVPDVASAIASLAPKLRAVLTTNLDHLLERAFSGRWPPLYIATPDFAQQHGVILKLHGTLHNRATWVLTESQYERAMYKDSMLQKAFEAIFLGRSILFVGYGLEDDDFKQMLARVRALAGAQPPRHFALVPEGSIGPSQAKAHRNAGIHLIPYEASNVGHDEVPRILRWIAAGDAVAAGTAPLSADRIVTFQPAPAALPPIVPAPPGRPPPPPGARYDPDWYVRRPKEEKHALDHLETPGTPVTIWAPSRFGKELLLSHVLEEARIADEAAGRRTVIVNINLRDLLSDPFDVDRLWESFAADLVEKTNGDAAWISALANDTKVWPLKLFALMKNRILPAVDDRLVLTINEADAVWGLAGQNDFYGVFRSWCDKASEQGWKKLRFVFLLSTASSLALPGPTERKSPFNLGLPIELPDFGIDEIFTFSQLHGLRWSRADIEDHLYPLVGGHPFLVHMLMYVARLSGVSLTKLAGDSNELDRLFGNQLSELARLLELEPSVAKAVQSILDNPRTFIPEDIYLRLRRAGLVKREGDRGPYAIRYGLYRDYLLRRWPRSV